MPDWLESPIKEKKVKEATFKMHGTRATVLDVNFILFKLEHFQTSDFVSIYTNKESNNYLHFYIIFMLERKLMES